MNQIPPALTSYIQQCTYGQSLTLLTSVLDTPANWLLIRFLLGTFGGRIRPGPQHDSPADTSGSNVILVSIWRSLDFWSELAGKSSFNVQNALDTGKLCYIDGLAGSSKTSKNVISLGSLTLESLRSALDKAVQVLSQRSTSSPTILFDGLDFVLASQHSITALDVQQMLLDLQQRAQNIIVTCAADSALLHNTDSSATPLETEHASLARSLAYGAQWVFQLRPLETGQSREVSGSVRVSKGGAWETVEGVKDPEEGEWLYHIKGNGSVTVWGRGEA